VSKLSSEYNIVLSDSASLAEKIRLFQTKCASLEQTLQEKEQAADDRITSMRELQAQIEEMVRQRKDEAARLEKERERVVTLEK
jgi:predicted nuclease with TOPRIM domain